MAVERDPRNGGGDAAEGSRIDRRLIGGRQEAVMRNQFWTARSSVTSWGAGRDRRVREDVNTSAQVLTSTCSA